MFILAIFSPNEFLHMPIENLLLEELPDCQTGLGNSLESDTVFDNGNTNNLAFWPPTPSAFDTNSPYVAIGVAAVLVTIAIIIVVVR